MFDYSLEYIFSYTVTLSPPEVVGPVPDGIRVNFHITGGEVSGPKVYGKFRPVGADWLLIRTDGVGILDVRATIETREEALIYAAYSGVADLGEDGYDRFLWGELPPTVPVRSVPRFLTTHPNLQWLNRLQGLAIGEFNAERLEVSYDAYSVH